MKNVLRSLAVLVLLATFATFCFGQAESGQINGTITDPSGAVVSGAKVTATSVDKGFSRTATSASNGSYVITNLPPSTYNISVEAGGFIAAKRQIIVSVGGRPTVDVALSVSSTSTTIEVTTQAAGVEVNTQNAELSQVVTESQIRELPTLTRDPYSLAATAGNVSSDPGGGNRGVGLNINGQRSASTDILLDGAENTDLFAVGVGQTVPLDSTQEMRVLTSNFGPEYGRASGGVVNVATKSGSNAFHGTVYEFNRLSAYASNDYNSNASGLPKARFTRNQFGFSVGGPVIKDKLFFFNNTEFTRVRSAANIQAQIVDPAFIALSNANTKAFYSAFGTLGAVSKIGVITRSGISCTGSCATSNPNFAALPGTTPIFDTVGFQAPADSGGGAPQNTYNSVSRVDFNFTDKTSVFGRYTILSEKDLDGFVNASPFAGYNTGQSNYDNNFLFSVTHVFSPKIVSATKFLFTRFNNLQPLGTVPVSPTLFFRADTAFTVQGKPVYGPGYSATTPGSAIPFGGPQNFGEIAEDLTWSKGAHELKFGGQYLYVKDNRSFGAYEEAVEALSASGLGAAYDNFLAGNLGLFQVALNPQGKLPCPRQPNVSASIVTPACQLTLPVGAPRFDRANRFSDSALYVNDGWKVMPHFTLNLGVRWEYYGVQHNNNPNFDSNFYFGSGATFFDQIRNGQVLTTPNAPNGSLWKPSYKNFGPRVGFAWDIFGNGKTSLRGGYGISYERNFNNVTFNVIQNPPNYAVVSFQPPGDAPVVNISTNNYGQFGTGVGLKNLPPVTLRAVDPNIKTAYSNSYDMSIEREVLRNSTVSISYSGSRGIHLYSIANINRTASGNVYLGDSRFGSRLNEQYSNINFRGSNGDSYYNGVNFAFRTNDIFHSGLSMTANYTYAHAIDNLSSTFTDGPANNNNLGFFDPFNPALDRGNADYDIRHRFVTSAVWDIPLGKGSSSKFVKEVIGGWTISPIATIRTGAPFSAFDCTNTAFAVCPRAIFPSTPNHTGDPTLTPIAGSPNLFDYLTWPGQSSAYGQYADPITGTGEYPTCTSPAVFGTRAASGCSFPAMSGRNAFRGPGAWNVDLGVYKTFIVTERTKLQFRSEFFNLANHANTFIVGNGTNDVSFAVLPSGQPYAQAFKDGRRQIQFAVKLIF